MGTMKVLLAILALNLALAVFGLPDSGAAQNQESSPDLVLSESALIATIHASNQCLGKDAYNCKNKAGQSCENIGTANPCVMECTVDKSSVPKTWTSQGDTTFDCTVTTPPIRDFIHQKPATCGQGMKKYELFSGSTVKFTATGPAATKADIHTTPSDNGATSAASVSVLALMAALFAALQ